MRVATSIELRVGAFAHSIGAGEAGGVDGNVEALLPRFSVPDSLGPEFAFLVTRPQIGGMINMAGKTSYAYVGVVWTVNLTPQFFLEPMFGGIGNSIGDTQLPHPGLEQIVETYYQASISTRIINRRQSWL